MAGSGTLILGGGFGGAAAALAVRRRLGDEHRVTLVDRRSTAYLCGANPLIAVGERPPEGTTRSLAELAAAGIEVVTAEIGAFDLDATTVVTAGGRHRFDHLVVALGAEYDWAAVPGSDRAHTFYHHEGTGRLRSRLDSLDAGTVAVVVAGAPVKCPPAAIEMILLIDAWARRRGIRERLDLHLAITEPAPLVVAGPEAGRTLTRVLDERGVTLHTEARLTEVAGGGTEARFADGSVITADPLIVIPVHRVPDVVARSGLTGDKPWIPVDPGTLATAVDGVYAVGDVATVPVGDKGALPKAGAFASGQGRVVGERIVADVLGTRPPDPYDGVGWCHLVVSPTEAAAVGGAFLASGGPLVSLSPATAAGMGELLRWEEDWRSYRL